MSAGKRQPAVSLERVLNFPPPVSLEAERAVIGAILIDPKSLAVIAEALSTHEAFSDIRLGVIYRSIREIVSEFGILDTVVLIDCLSGEEVMGGVNVAEMLMELTAAVPSSAHARHYAKIVRDKWDMRRLLATVAEIAHDAHHSGIGENEASAIIRRAESRIVEIGADTAQNHRPESAGDVSRRVVAAATDDESDNGPCWSTGFWEIDKGLTGLRPGDLMVLAARPGSGKTSLALSMAAQMCGGAQDLGALFVSRETSRERLMHRFLAIVSGIPSRFIRDGQLSQSQRETLKKSLASVERMQLIVDDRTMKSVSDIAERLRLMKHRHRVDVVFVDYLQIVDPPRGPGVKFVGTEERTAAVSKAMKEIALDNGVALVCLAQLNREMLKRADDDQRPRLSDLRGSGQIEQDADVIGLMHRPWIHLRPEQRAEQEWNKGTTTIYFDKVRDGSQFHVVLDFHGETTNFSSLAPPVGVEGLPF